MQTQNPVRPNGGWHFIVLVAALGAGLAYAEPNPDGIVYNSKAQTYSLHFTGTDIQTVLRELATKGDLQILQPSGPPSFMVSINLQNAPLERVLPRLFASRNNIITYDTDNRTGKKQVKIVLLSADGELANAGQSSISRPAYQPPYPSAAPAVDAAVDTVVDSAVDPAPDLTNAPRGVRRNRGVRGNRRMLPAAPAMPAPAAAVDESTAIPQAVSAALPSNVESPAIPPAIPPADNADPALDSGGGGGGDPTP